MASSDVFASSNNPSSSGGDVGLNMDLRCPRCLTPLCAPIQLCSSGHSVCVACRRELVACPVCKATFADVRSMSLEQVAARTPMKCTNARFGCGVVLKPAELCRHEQNCLHQASECFMGRIWDDCSWSGRGMDFLEHCEQQHGTRMFRDAVMEFEWACVLQQQPKRLAAYYVCNVYGKCGGFLLGLIFYMLLQ